MFKKALSLLLSLMLLVTSLSAAAISTFAADAATYVVAGTENLCGISWNGNPEEATECVMTAKDDGTYEKVFAAVAPTEAAQFKVVENAADGTQTWIGDSTDNNITFDVTVECDVTVTFNPETKEITVTGDGVVFKTELAIDAMYAVGNAADETDPWLNGVTWQPNADVNKMTEVAENVYEITFADVEGPFDAYQVKFAANGTWADSWGGVYAESGVAFDAQYNGDNLIVTVPYELADVKLTLDLNGFDYATKTGGKITIDVTEAGAVATEATTEEATEATEATTEAATEVTEAPAKALTVKSTSNLFAETVQSFDAETKQVTVTYFFESQKDVLNAQWSLTYDPTVLKVTPKNNLNGNVAPSYMPVIGINGAVYNILAVEDMKEVNGNASSLTLYPFKDGRKAFVSVTFDVIGEGETTVDLKVDVLTLCEINEDTFQADNSKQVKVVRNGEIEEEGYALLSNMDNVVYAGGYNPEAVMPETVATEATTKATEATTTEATEPTTEATEPTTEATEPTTEEVTEQTTVATEPTTTEVTEPTTEEATTVAPGFAVTGTSNFFPKTTQNFNAGTKQVTVTYFIESQKDVLNAQWTLKYDPEVLQIVPKNNLNGNAAPSYMPVCGINGAVYNIIPAEKELNGNASSLALYPFKDGRKAFVSVTFDVLKEEDTTVDLNVKVLTLGEINEDTFQADINKQVKVVRDGVIEEAGNALINNIDTVVYAGLFNPDAVMPEEEETTEATEATTTEATEPTTTEATEPTTEATEATTTAPSMDLTVVGTSNFFPESKQVIAETEKNVTVTYYFESAKALLNAQWELTYDPAVLTLNAENNKNVMPVIESGLVTNFATAGKGYGNCSNLGLYNFDAKAPFVTLVFDKAEGATGETIVDLQVVAMTLSQLNPTTGESDEAAEETIVKNGSIYSTATEYSTETVVTPGIVVPEVTTEPTTVATEPTTEATEPTTETVPTEPRPTLPGADPDKFFVVAGDEGLCGSAWNPADRDNEMKFNTATGLYEKMYLDVAANTYNFKVTTNGAWDNGDFNLEGDAMFGGPNATVTVPEDGSVVIISFNGQKAFVDVYGPGVEFPTFPEEPTTVPTEPTTVPTVPTTVPTEPTTEATVPTETVPATTQDATTQDATTATDATSATGSTVDGGSTADTPNGGNGSVNGGAVQTGNASMAVIILLVLISATGVIYFTRKRAR